MIVTFHTIFSFFLEVLQKCRSKSDSLLKNGGDAEDNLLLFDPPVYKQRYGAVHNILLENPWKNEVKKIADFGCAEFQLFPFVKWFNKINEIVEVDIDAFLLKNHLYRIHPLTCDYLSKRQEPLTIRVFQGSASDPDDCLVGVDAVIAIELIEHLFPDDLDALPYNVFGFIRPKIAIFTTPNADFNVLFPNFSGFRHADHKFEWSREQFEAWATNLTQRFPNYSVTFEGIGEGPKGTEHLGCCSQMAVFVLNQPNNNDGAPIDSESFGTCRHNCYSELIYKSGNAGNYYTLISTIEYPYEQDDRSPDQKILHELQYGIQLRSNINGRFYNDEQQRFEIPLTELIYTYRSTIATELEARGILQNADYKIEQCKIFEVLEDCVVFEPDMEEDRTSTPVTPSSDITDTMLEDTSLDWTYNPEEDDPWSEEASQASREIVDGLVNNLSLTEDKPKTSNGINVFLANDVQKLIPIYDHERKIRLKQSEAGPSYCKKRKRKLHDDDNESLLDVFRNAELENKLTEANKTSDSDTDLQNEANNDLEVEVASREALFDPDSVIELGELDNLVGESLPSQPNLIVIGINLDEENQTDGPVLPINVDPFPNWLLQMLGAEVVVDDMGHDEPHFYCQGDGVGVHPSFIEGEFEEDHSSSGSESSSNESNETPSVSNDAAEAEPTVSEVEVNSLPEDTVLDTVTNPAEEMLSSSTETFVYYDTTDDTTNNTGVNNDNKNATTSTKE